MSSLPVLIERRHPEPQLHSAAISAGYSDLQARILASRLPQSAANDVAAHVRPTLRQLDPPDRLPDIDVAAKRIADFVMDPSQRAVVISDHDVDGMGGHSVLRTAFIEYFFVDHRRVGGVLSHKRKEGFGVSEALLERLVAQYPPPALCITVDQGSQDEARFKRMVELGYTCLVTDHHEVHVPPPSAIACVNPTREDSQFPDRYISGAHVAFLLACAVRKELIARGHLRANAPSLTALLDWVGTSAVADAVSISKSVNNRAVISHALSMMNHAPRPAWVAMRQIMKKEGDFTEQDLAMSIAPRLNAISRMGDALPGVKFLRTQDLDTALQLAAHADVENQARKSEELKMLDVALALAAPQAAAGRHAICVHLKEGVSSIHGIVASRLVEAFGRPAVCLSPKFGSPGVLTGSLRSIAGVNIHHALDMVDDLDPDATISHGGHAGAGGCSLHEEMFDRFANAFDKAVSLQRDLRNAQPVILSDGELARPLDESVLDEIAAIGPFGREFEAPLFEGSYYVTDLRWVGDGTHAKLTLVDDQGVPHDAIWFRAMKQGEAAPVAPMQRIRAVFALSANIFRGKRRIDMQVKHATVIP